MRNTLYKAYLDDFAAFCGKLGGTTAEVMSDLLAFEADRRALNITLNSIGTGGWYWRGCCLYPICSVGSWFCVCLIVCLRRIGVLSTSHSTPLAQVRRLQVCI